MPGPDRAEHRLRLAVSLAGLALLGAVFVFAPVEGMAWVEVVAIAGLFFGGSAVVSARALMRR
jgi:hypothetical protein